MYIITFNHLLISKASTSTEFRANAEFCILNDFQFQYTYYVTSIYYVLSNSFKCLKLLV